MCTFYLYLSIIPQCGLHKTSNILIVSDEIYVDILRVYLG